MLFSIITPTYKRSDKLLRALQSVIAQTCSDWEMVIINDSPSDTLYQSFAASVSDPRVRYYTNDENRGVNYSRNRGLDSLSKDSEWVIFLDDDDYLTPDTLANFKNLIDTNPDKKWFVTNRVYANGNPITKFPKEDADYSYTKDYLILKKCKGDVTHCIATTLIGTQRFSKNIKQAEEWLFFYQIGLHEKMYYHNHNSTITDGYTELNFRKRTRREQLQILATLVREGSRLHLLYHPTFILYLKMRLLRLCLKA